MIECPVFIAHAEPKHGLALLGAVPRKDRASYFFSKGQGCTTHFMIAIRLSYLFLKRSTTWAILFSLFACGCVDVQDAVDVTLLGGGHGLVISNQYLV
jgi:hypothetical protein